MRRESLLMVIRASTNFETAHKPAEIHFDVFLTAVKAVRIQAPATLRAARAFGR